MNTNEAAIRKAYQVAEDKDIVGWVNCFTKDGTFTDESIGVTYRGPNELVRVEVRDGRAAHHDTLRYQSPEIPRCPPNPRQQQFPPDRGFRKIRSLVIQGDAFAVTPIHGGFATPTSVARIGTTAWVTEGQLAFFFDPSKKNSSPSLPFRIYPVPLRKEDTK